MSGMVHSLSLEVIEEEEEYEFSENRSIKLQDKPVSLGTKKGKSKNATELRITKDYSTVKKSFSPKKSRQKKIFIKPKHIEAKFSNPPDSLKNFSNSTVQVQQPNLKSVQSNEMEVDGYQNSDLTQQPQILQSTQDQQPPPVYLQNVGNYNNPLTNQFFQQSVGQPTLSYSQQLTNFDLNQNVYSNPYTFQIQSLQNNFPFSQQQSFTPTLNQNSNQVLSQPYLQTLPRKNYQSTNQSKKKNGDTPQNPKVQGPKPKGFIEKPQRKQIKDMTETEKKKTINNLEFLFAKTKAKCGHLENDLRDMELDKEKLEIELETKNTAIEIVEKQRMEAERKNFEYEKIIEELKLEIQNLKTSEKKIEENTSKLDSEDREIQEKLQRQMLENKKLSETHLENEKLLLKYKNMSENSSAENLKLKNKINEMETDKKGYIRKLKVLDKEKKGLQDNQKTCGKQCWNCEYIDQDKSKAELIKKRNEWHKKYAVVKTHYNYLRDYLDKIDKDLMDFGILRISYNKMVIHQLSFNESTKKWLKIFVGDLYQTTVIRNYPQVRNFGFVDDHETVILSDHEL